MRNTKTTHVYSSICHVQPILTPMMIFSASSSLFKVKIIYTDKLKIIIMTTQWTESSRVSILIFLPFSLGDKK